MSTYSKQHPFLTKIRERVLLNPNSTKKTYHIALDNPEGHLPFTVGDSVAVFPENDPALIDSILTALSSSGSETIFDARANEKTSLRTFLTRKANLTKCTSILLKALGERGAPIPFLEDKTTLTEFLQTHHLIDILSRFPTSIEPQEVCSLLLPMMPRFYSIASSTKMYPHEIHLTIAELIYPTPTGPRHGVATYYLSHLATTDIPIYIQPSNNFTLPHSPDTDIIMVGPGTGIAPFRAFLQERTALAHTGRNWLFFGERNRATDFYYSDYFLSLEKQNRLRLDLAFSRDQAEKVYVQHLLWQHRNSIYDWIQNGASFYVCGDAEKMAKDVEATLLRIARDVGNHSEESARNWLKTLRKERRYLQDVY